MRRLYIRIFVALVVTVVLSFIAFTSAIFRMAQPGAGRLLQTVPAPLVDEATAALKAGGPTQARAVLESSERVSGGRHYLTDADGRDLVTGEDRSALLRRGLPFPLGAPSVLPGIPFLSSGTPPYPSAVPPSGPRTPPFPPRGLLFPQRTEGPPLVYRTPDGQYALIALGPAPLGPLDLWPFYAVLAAAVAGVCWMLAIDIARPLRRMSKVLDAFGQGQLRARTGLVRSDEIGTLAHSIDGMADRIETLVSAERRLLQDVSHELRSPITRMKVAIELSRTMPDRDAAATFLQRDVDRLSFLVGALLEVTRLEGDARLVSAQEVHLTALLSEIATDVELEAREKQVRIAIPTTTAHVAGDRELLRRAFENVIRNAIRHAPASSSIDVHVEASPTDVTVNVRDYGSGVPSDAIEHLGTPFFRVDESGGLGLGLSIARRAIQRHGGRWHAENAHPGLRVMMTIPQRQVTADSTLAFAP